ncbi:DUF4115 domain-containing protein [Terasakiella sp. A23]|nr:RodZ domain-containing protein [Terasakiella sp. A23]MDV7339775.1 DUF4115 domain-containing protein [Terasakiella sp. A23]
MIRNKGRTAQAEPVNQGPGVSELLKTTRERAGQELKTVADVLRIRYVYLEAIEDGRFEDLPGKTYVVGFVRAYAEHLGLDAEEVVKRFKDEIAGLEGKAELVFPSPVTEQSVPGGALILISIVIMVAVYGGWYFLSSQDRSVAELVPDLPAKFAEMVDKVKDNKSEEKAEEKPVEEAAVETTEPAEPVSEADTQDMAQVARAAVEKAEKTAEEVVTSVETVKVETPAPVVEEAEAAVEEKTEDVAETVEEVTAEAAEKVEETAVVVEEKVEEKVEEATTEVAAVSEAPAEPETPAEPEVAPEPEPEPEPAQPQVMKEKIVLKAIDYVWMQLANPDGSIAGQKVLEEGDEFEVPNTVGLILRTGNAGGLEVYVDGKKAPSLGEPGDVRSNIQMNPEKLLAGKAVEG